MEAIFCFFPSHFHVIHALPTRIVLAFYEQTDIPNSATFPILVPIRLLRTVFQIRVLQMGVRTRFFQVRPLGLRCWTKIWTIYDVEVVSICLNILTLEF